MEAAVTETSDGPVRLPTGGALTNDVQATPRREYRRTKITRADCEALYRRNNGRQLSLEFALNEYFPGLTRTPLQIAKELKRLSERHNVFHDRNYCVSYWGKYKKGDNVAKAITLLIASQDLHNWLPSFVNRRHIATQISILKSFYKEDSLVVSPEEAKELLENPEVKSIVEKVYGKNHGLHGADIGFTIQGAILRAHLSSRTRKVFEALGLRYHEGLVKDMLNNVAALSEYTGVKPDINIIHYLLHIQDRPLATRLLDKLKIPIAELIEPFDAENNRDQYFTGRRNQKSPETRQAFRGEATRVLAAFDAADFEDTVTVETLKDKRTAILQAVVDSLVTAKDIANLSVLEQALPGVSLPVTQSVLRESLARLMKNPGCGRFADEYTEIAAELFRIFRPQYLSSDPHFRNMRSNYFLDAISLLERPDDRKEFQRNEVLEEYLGIPKGLSDKELGLYCFCHGPHIPRTIADRVWAATQGAGSVASDDVKHALHASLHLLGNGIEAENCIIGIEEICSRTGIRPELDERRLEQICEDLANGDRAGYGKLSRYSRSIFLFLVWVELYQGRPPKAASLDSFRVYSYGDRFHLNDFVEESGWNVLERFYGTGNSSVLKKFGLLDLPIAELDDLHSLGGPYGPPIRDWCRDRYGPITTAIAHRVITKAIIEGDSAGSILREVALLIEETGGQTSIGIIPDMETMERIVPFEARKFDDQYQDPAEFLRVGFWNGCCASLAHYREMRDLSSISSYERLLGLDFELSDTEVQLCYMVMLPRGFYFHDHGMEEERPIEVRRREGIGQAVEAAQFLTDRTGVLPAATICDRVYFSLLSCGEYLPGDVEQLAEGLRCLPTAKTVKEALHHNISAVAQSASTHGKESIVGILEYIRSKPREYPELIDYIGSQDFAVRIFSLVLSSKNSQHDSVQTILNWCDISVSPAFADRNYLGNQKFWGKVDYPIDSAALERHFSNPQNVNVLEFCRVVQVLGRNEYFQEALTDLRARNSTEAHERRAQILCALARCEDDPSTYRRLVQEINGIRRLRIRSLTTTLAWTYRELIECGEHYLPREFARLIRQYAKRVADSSCRVMPNYDEDLALRTLLRYSTWDGNRALFALTFSDGVDRRLKRLVLNRLSQRKHFFPQYTAKRVKRALEGNEVADVEQRRQFRELRFFRAIRDIPGVDLVERSKELFDRGFRELEGKKISAHELWTRHGPHIPECAFYQTGMLVAWEPALIEKIDQVYQFIDNQTDRNNLLVGITTAAQAVELRAKHIRRLLGAYAITCREEALTVSDFLRRIGAIGLGEVHRDVQITHPQITACLEVESLASANEKLIENEVLIVTLFGIKKLPQAAYDRVRKRWENPDPILPLSVRLNGNSRFDAQDLFFRILEAAGHEDRHRWDAFLYDKQNRQVADQIGGLTSEQFNAWHDNKIAPVKSAAEIVSPQQALKYIRNEFDQLLTVADSSSDDDFQKGVLAEFQENIWLRYKDESMCGETLTHVAARYSNQTYLVRKKYIADQCRLVKVILEEGIGALSANSSVAINTRTLQVLCKLQKFSGPSADFSDSDSPSKRFRRLKGQGIRSVAREELLPDHELEVIRKSVEKTIENTSNGTTLQELTAQAPVSIILKRFSALRDLASLASIAAGEGTMLDNATAARLRSFFPNIHTRRILKALELLAPDCPPSHLVVFTDDPEIMIQVGKTPRNASTCINYEGSAHRVQLLPSNIADAHIKELILVSLLKVGKARQIGSTEPRAIWKSIREKPLSKSEILDNSVARKIGKLVYEHEDGSDGNRAVFAEVLYPYGAPKIWNDYLDRFCVDTFLSMKIFEEGEEQTVRVPGSRNKKDGQLEDRRVADGRNYPMSDMRGTYTMKGSRVKLLAGEDFLSALVDAELGEAELEDAERGFSVNLDQLEAAFEHSAITHQGYRVGERFDLRSAEFGNDQPVARIIAAEKNTDCHMIRVITPSAEQSIALVKAGYFYAPGKVGYVYRIPDGFSPVDQHGSGYIDSLHGASKRRAAFRRVYAALDCGELTYLDAQTPETLSYFPEFLGLYKQEMQGKERGWTPLIDAVKAAGSPAAFIKQGHHVRFILEQGRVIGGIVTSRSKEGYSIGYSAMDSEAKRKHRVLQTYLISRLVVESHAQGLKKVYYGQDTNLYGHHLSLGLAEAKIATGFEPYPVFGNDQLVKFLKFDVFHFPILLYTYAGRHSLRRVVIVDDASSKQGETYAQTFPNSRVLRVAAIS